MMLLKSKTGIKAMMPLTIILCHSTLTMSRLKKLFLTSAMKILKKEAKTFYCPTSRENCMLILKIVTDLLDAIASPSSYPCRSVNGSVIESFRLEIASVIIVRE